MILKKAPTDEVSGSEVYELFDDRISIGTVRQSKGLWVACEHSWLAPSSRHPYYAWDETRNGAAAALERMRQSDAS